MLKLFCNEDFVQIFYLNYEVRIIPSIVTFRKSFIARYKPFLEESHKHS